MGYDSSTTAGNFQLELSPFGLEHLCDYESGGHHPVHLGDLLGHEGRYRVVHKLGNGGAANIWLCSDTGAGNTTKYVAVKLLMADVSTSDCPEFRVSKLGNMPGGLCQDNDSVADSICFPLDQFKVHGPNGEHLCFVYPLLGPKASVGLFGSHYDADKILRAICFKVVQAVAFLHSHEICHGGKLGCPQCTTLIDRGEN